MAGAMGWSTLLNPISPKPDPHQMERVATEKSALEAALNQQEKKLEKLSLEARTLHMHLAPVHTCTMCAHIPCVHMREPGPLEACIVHAHRASCACRQASHAGRLCTLAAHVHAQSVWRTIA